MNEQGHFGELPTLPERYQSSFELSIESAQVEGEKRRIKGTANTFSVMRSGRIMHPGPMETLVQRTGGAVNLPLLAQHGMVSGFATIGRITGLRVVGGEREKRLHFEGELVSGTELSEQAWTLLQQKALRSLSIGWIGRQGRIVRAGDSDLDPWLAHKLQEAGAEQAYAFLDWELLEISVVDVPDDAGATLAARLLDDVKTQLGQGGGDAALRGEVAKLRSELDAIRAAGSPAAAEILTAVGEAFSEWRERFVDACVEALETDAGVAQAAADRAAALDDLADDAPDGDDEDAGDGADFARLRGLLREAERGR